MSASAQVCVIGDIKWALIGLLTKGPSCHNLITRSPKNWGIEMLYAEAGNSHGGQGRATRTSQIRPITSIRHASTLRKLANVVAKETTGPNPLLAVHNYRPFTTSTDHMKRLKHHAVPCKLTS